MYLFALLLFPCVFVGYVTQRFAEVRSRLLIAFAFFVGAGLIGAFRGFFMFRSLYDGDSVVHFFLEQWVGLSLFPFCVYLLFLCVSRDTWQIKIGSYALCMLPFYAVYLPCEIFAYPVPLPFFLLFVKPVLYLVMVVAVGSELRTISEALVTKGGALIGAFFILLVTCSVPALIETLWYYAFPTALWCALAIAYIALCALRSQLVFALKDEIARSAQKEAVPRHE